ncbi:MAG: RluA family pseudouridine synthase [Deltaproteobacteria bacterium]|nr:RluA family pseudouridine synthase [Deltaproteobacteria bacterium]
MVTVKQRFEVSPEDAGKRLDVYVSSLAAELSRNQVQKLIKQEQVRVNDLVEKASYAVRPGDVVTFNVPPPPPAELIPEAIPVDILFEDDFLIVVNKPPGMVVHPASGHRQGTLVHGLLYHCGQLAPLGGPLRPGVVHRLDKNTSGILVVAKNNEAYYHLSRQFKKRSVYKEYCALVHGRMAESSGCVEAPMHRSQRNRKKMGVVAGGRQAFTEWRVEAEFSEATLLKVIIKTGRTHQIRVHLAHIHHPVVGDTTYGGRRRSTAIRNPLVRARFNKVKRQLLHARSIMFEHPATGKRVEFNASLPEDFASVVNFLQIYDRKE